MTYYESSIINVNFDPVSRKFVARSSLLPNGKTLGNTPEEAITSLRIAIQMYKQVAIDTQKEIDQIISKFSDEFIEQLLYR